MQSFVDLMSNSENNCGVCLRPLSYCDDGRRHRSSPAACCGEIRWSIDLASRASCENARRALVATCNVVIGAGNPTGARLNSLNRSCLIPCSCPPDSLVTQQTQHWFGDFGPLCVEIKNLAPRVDESRWENLTTPRTAGMAIMRLIQSIQNESSALLTHTDER